jgi:S1-C subfamily serine protease
MTRIPLLALLVTTFAFAIAAPAAPPPSAPAEPKYVDDDALYEAFFNKVEALAKAKKPLAHEQLVAKLKSRSAGITPAKPGNKVLSPEEVYKTAVQSVFIVGSVHPDKDGSWATGTYATAWVLAADGVLVTNHHVFEDLKPGEVFGAADHKGNVYPVIDILGGDKTADVAVFRIAAQGLTPLPVATAHAEVGSWVGVISHPGDLFYMYTQGAVTRYSTNTNDDGKVEKWMGITAEYASGASGAPVLNKYGAVVGIAALTLSLDAIDDAKNDKNPTRRKPTFRNMRKLSRFDQPKADPKKDDKPKPPPKPGDKGSPQQMVVKMAVPVPVLLKWLK